MTGFTSALIWLAAALAVIPMVILQAEILAGLVPGRRHALTGGAFPKSVVVMPAHNEELIISHTVSATLRCLPPNTTLLVVADNCSDATAKLAAAAGAAIIERANPDQRGKGFALAFAGGWLQADPPEYIVILDADTVITPESLSLLIEAAQQSARPVQANYVFISPLNGSPLVQISNFAFYIKNVVRQRGMTRIGDTAILTGAGMAFSWSQFRAVALPTGEIVEDLAMGLTLVRSGHPPVFLDEARVTSSAAAQGDTLNQRQRWEHGYMATMWRHALPCLWDGLTSANRAKIWTGLHLLVPPLVFLMLMAGFLLLVQFAAVLAGSSRIPAIILAIQLVLLVLSLGCSWLAGGRSFLSPSALFKVPVYIVWKIPIYLRLLVARQAIWNRTRREGE